MITYPRCWRDLHPRIAVLQTAVLAASPQHQFLRGPTAVKQKYHKIYLNSNSVFIFSQQLFHPLSFFLLFVNGKSYPRHRAHAQFAI